MNVLIHSNAPWSLTGYGVQTSLIAPRLAKRHKVSVSAFYGLEGNRLDFNGIPVLPGEPGTYGNEIIVPHAEQQFGHPTDGLVLTLLDVWVLDAKTWSELNVASWVPVDHEPVPPKVRTFFEESGAVPVAMSRFGQEQLDGLGPLYCPHGIDLDAYKPVPKAEARRRANLPQQGFVVGMVAANKGGPPSRKCFEEAIEAFKHFQDRHDDAVLYLHTDMVAREGMNLPGLMSQLDMQEKRVYITERHRYRYNPLPPRMMASMYSAFDVLLNPSAGEGFGIPVLEAAATGVPSIVTDFSAMPEVAADGASWRVQGYRSWTGQLSWQRRPIVEEIVEDLESCYRRPKAEVKRMAQLAREHAEQYEIDKVVKEYMLPALDEAASRLEITLDEPVAA